MARNRRNTEQKEAQNYPHDTATRKNDLPASIATHDKIKEAPKQEYAYNPHLPPELQLVPNGDGDKFPKPLPKV